MAIDLNGNLALERLPAVTLVGEGSDVELNLAHRSGEIARLAELLRGRFRTGDRVALLFGTEPRLILCWLAALHAGLEPLILQYPSAKQSVETWRSNVFHAFFRAALAGMVCSSDLERHQLTGCRPLFLTDKMLSAAKPAELRPLRGDAGLLQMSSGTTGHRKPLRLTLDQVATHVRDYNQTLHMGPEDRIVSWLPLYHDMGFIACFVMPLMLGVPIVMMDPMTWVVRPKRLFEAVARYKPTTCYMPNFGFEVMAREAGGESLPSMRRWISCSEVVQPATLERFAAATATTSERFSACYAMAENVFAVTQQDGLKVVDLDGRALASCGRPIANVDLKIVDGEIWVRSPSSLRAYLHDAPVTDREGFYPTGDLGRMIDDELVVIGRKHDLVNIAGRKWLLHELDQSLAKVLPMPDGRAGALARREPALGTELPLFLIEDRDFYLRSDVESIRAQLAQQIDMESFSIEFVPPGFLTKTSSGKLNRSMSVASYDAAARWRASVRDHRAQESVVDEITRLFGATPADAPVESLLDSLGLVTLEALLQSADMRLDPRLSLAAHLDSLRARGFDRTGSGEACVREHISIVAVSDRRTVRGITESDLKKLSDAAGVQVTLEFVSVPPAPVLLSDLVFFDYFLPSVRSESYREVIAALSKLRNASLLMVDDVGELLFGNFAYPALNHRMERSPAADLLVWRWQKYTRNHDELPISVVNLWQTYPLRNELISRLGRYLGVPVFRIACLHSFAELTDDWDFVERSNADWTEHIDIDSARVVARLSDYLRAHGPELPRRTGPVDPRPVFENLDHFCSMYVDRAKVERILERFDRFCLIGPRSAVPFIRRRLSELGKPYIDTSNQNLAAQGYSDQDFDCVLQVGSWGRVATARPAFQIFSAGWDPMLGPTHVEGELIEDPGWFHANPASAPNELSERKSVLWMLDQSRPASPPARLRRARA